MQQHRSGVVVRPLQQQDKQQWWELFRDYITWYKASVSDEVVELTWQRIMAGGEGNHQALVAEGDGGQVSWFVPFPF